MLVMMHDLGTAVQLLASPYLHSVMGLKAKSMHELITESLRGATPLASWQTETKNVILQLQ